MGTLKRGEKKAGSAAGGNKEKKKTDNSENPTKCKLSRKKRGKFKLFVLGGDKLAETIVI